MAGETRLAVLKSAIALKISAADLMVATESNLRAASKLRT
jgi:hypothetical protein